MQKLTSILLPLFIAIFAVLLSGVVRAEDEREAISISGLVPEPPKKALVAGEKITFIAKYDGSLFHHDLEDLRLNVVRKRTLLGDEKFKIEKEAVVYGAKRDSDGFQEITLTLPVILNNGHYYLEWETKWLDNAKAISDSFDVVSANEGNAQVLKDNPEIVNFVKPDQSPPNGSNVTDASVPAPLLVTPHAPATGSQQPVVAPLPAPVPVKDGLYDFEKVPAAPAA